MEKTILFRETTPEQLQAQINEGVKQQLQEFLETYKPQQPNDYLTRSEVAKMLSVNLSTLFNWAKNGKLTPLGIGNRVYYRRSDIEKSLIPLNS